MTQSKPTLQIEALDHLVLTVADIDRTIAFYENVLGMQAEAFTPATGETRWALKFGRQKVNLHKAGAEFDPKAHRPTPGSADLCFLSAASPESWVRHLAEQGIDIEEGPITRTGAMGPILSIYIRDPDQNLIEIAQPQY
jgi:catechol 2,3-dioxygenase-like lactoylglutathione lyase family enzyme